jgi:voltage-gated potassium channel
LPGASERSLRERRRTNLHALAAAVAIWGLLFIAAIAFYRFKEHYSILDAIFMTVITVSTVGYGEPKPLSPAGELFTSLLIIGGIATATLAAWHAAELVVGQELWDFWGRRRRMKAIERVRDHHIICGYGRMGQEIVKQLMGHGAALVVIERDAELAARLQEAGILFVAGNATDDAVLLGAGIARAKSLVAVTSTDEDNLFLTVSARVLNPGLYIVARCADPRSQDKFVRAGASRVISPYVTGGRQMAAALVRPVLVDFLDLLLQVEESDLDIAQVTVTPQAAFAGLTLSEAAIREQCGAGIIAVRGPDGRFHTNPPPEYVIRPGDVLIALGPPEQLSCLEGLCGCKVE